ncbi:LysE family translocator [soil metagenome]
MPELSTLLLFAAASFALIVIPGPAVLYVVTRSLDQGRGAGFASVIGVSVGAYVHIIAAAVGLSAILSSSVVAFSIIKYAGAAYLVYLGIRKLASKPQLEPAQAVEPQPLHKIFLEGIVVNILNPKTALFFLAFLPQFVNADSGRVASQILVLGTVFVLVAVVSDGAYALLASTFGGWLKSNRSFLRVQHYLSGTIYLVLGLGAALSGSGRSK